MSYDLVGDVSEELLLELKGMLKTAVWKQVKDDEKHFYTFFPDIEVGEISPLGKVERAFFLKIPPGGMVHKHTDGKVGGTFHIPVKTNGKAICYMLDKPYKLKVGKVYSVNRQVEHHSTNDGKTDRIHLIVECRI